MLFRITIDGIEYATETDRDVRYAVIGRVPASTTGPGTVEDTESGLGRRINPGVATDSGPGGKTPPSAVRQVLGWCTTRDEAEVSLQKLFTQKLFSDLEIVPVPSQ